MTNFAFPNIVLSVYYLIHYIILFIFTHVFILTRLVEMDKKVYNRNARESRLVPEIERLFALKNYAKLQIEQRINFIVEKQGNILCK